MLLNCDVQQRVVREEGQRKRKSQLKTRVKGGIKALLPVGRYLARINLYPGKYERVD